MNTPISPVQPARSRVGQSVGISQKFQKKVAQAVKRARHLAILPFVTDCMK